MFSYHSTLTINSCHSVNHGEYKIVVQNREGIAQAKMNLDIKPFNSTDLSINLSFLEIDKECIPKNNSCRSVDANNNELTFKDLKVTPRTPYSPRRSLIRRERKLSCSLEDRLNKLSAPRRSNTSHTLPLNLPSNITSSKREFDVASTVSSSGIFTMDSRSSITSALKSKPEILKHLPQTITCKTGKKAVLTCHAKSHPKAKIVWMKDANIIPYKVGISLQQFKLNSVGKEGVGYTLTIENVSEEHSGKYSIAFMNVAGDAMSQTSLKVVSNGKNCIV